MFWIALFLFSCVLKRCIVFPSTKPVLFPFLHGLESINIIGSIILLFLGQFAMFINAFSHIKESRFCAKVINLSRSIVCVSFRGRNLLGLFMFLLFSAITSEMDIKFCCFAEFFSFWRRILMVQNGLCAGCEFIFEFSCSFWLSDWDYKWWSHVDSRRAEL